jgi:excinuclease ABC subunit A
MEAWLDRVMVERVCPDCRFSAPGITPDVIHGRRQDVVRRRPSFTSMSCEILRGLRPAGRGADAGRQGSAIVTRLELLLGIGLDYLNFNRRSSTLFRRRNRSASDFPPRSAPADGRTYVLDEPSIDCTQATT